MSRSEGPGGHGERLFADGANGGNGAHEPHARYTFPLRASCKKFTVGERATLSAYGQGLNAREPAAAVPDNDAKLDVPQVVGGGAAADHGAGVRPGTGTGTGFWSSVPPPTNDLEHIFRAIVNSCGYEPTAEVAMDLLEHPWK